MVAKPPPPNAEVTDGRGPKLGWLITLKTSQRNCRFKRSVSLVILMMFASHCLKPGPRRLFRPQVPSFPSAGFPKAVEILVMNVSLEKSYCGGARQSARETAWSCPEWSEERPTGVQGRPVSAVKTVPISHPSP